MHVFGLQLGAALLGARILVTAQEAVSNLRGVPSQYREDLADTLLNDTISFDEVGSFLENPEQNVSDEAAVSSQLTSMSSWGCPECDRKCRGTNVCDKSYKASQNGWCWKFCHKRECTSAGCVKWQCDGEADQSPVTIETDVAKDSGRWDLLSSASYRPVSAWARQSGHGVEVKPIRGSFGSLRVEHDVYQAVSFHFHCPSEHTDSRSDSISMHHYSCELHVVHETPGCHNCHVRKRVVVALRYTPSHRTEDPFLSRIGISKPRLGHVEGGVDLSRELAILKEGFYTYHGSLTTPPCTANVFWIVAAKPITMSWDQKKSFEGLGLEEVFRDVKPLGNRIISKYSR